MATQIFSVQVFFIIFREIFESSIVISILLSFINQHYNQESKAHSKLRLQVWLGAFLGLFICVIIGTVFVSMFYLFGENYWSNYERIWEGAFSLLSCFMITVMGVGLLRINQMSAKWKWKLSTGLAGNEPPESEDSWWARFYEKYSLMFLPMLTLLREGMESIVFIGGVGVSEPRSSFPLSIGLAFALGISVGIFMYRGGNKMRLQYFLIGSSCFLYMISAGLMSRGVWFFELEQYVQRCNGQDMSEVGNGPGSYDISKSVWHVNCCNGLKDGYWMLLNAIFGWTNSATWGSVLSYNIYWLFFVGFLHAKLYEEKHGLLPYIPAKYQLKRLRKRFAMINYDRKLKAQAEAVVRESALEQENQGLLVN